MGVIHKIGRRKTSVARVYMSEGDGDVIINGRSVDAYFPSPTLIYKIHQPFLLTDTKGSFDLSVNVYGGGFTGQAEAVRLAVSRALCEVDPGFRGVLHPEGLLTRDSRMVERKKFGQKKARKKFQFSKR